jgi:hypothetical protein
MTIRRSSDKWLPKPTNRSNLVDFIWKEKYLRDMYIELFNFWNYQPLEVSARIKQDNLILLKSIAKEYGVADPTKGFGIGDFEEPLQTNFDDKLATAKTTVYLAVRTLAWLEEKNIELIYSTLSTVNKQLVKDMLNNLREDSFVALQKLAERIVIITSAPYEAQVLTQAQVDKILGLT